MDLRRCVACNKTFIRCPQVFGQIYCSTTTCQRERRRRAQKAKRKNDPDYKDNQIRAQKAWSKRNPKYWQDYRKTNPKSKERNRELQKERNQKRKKKLIAKMHPHITENQSLSGLYCLTPLFAPGIAKMDQWIVEIKIITTS